MTNTDKNVYILGAGFSKELGLPLQDDFLLIAKEVYFRNPQKYKHFDQVFDYQDSLSKMRQFLNYPLLNLEHLFNIMEMDIFYSKSRKVSKIKSAFVRLVCDVMMEQTPSPFFHDEEGKLKVSGAYDNYLTFLSLFAKASPYGIDTFHDTIITFNYDLVIEASTALYNWNRNQNQGRRVHHVRNHLYLNTLFRKDNIVLQPIEQFFMKNGELAYCYPMTIYSEAEDAVKLIKLHGSINWKTSTDGKTFIVPPTWNKSDPAIRKLWDIAYRELIEAKRIVVIGYSFPETDSYVKSLLALALNESRILQNIYFVNPDRDHTKTACLNLLDKYFEKHCAYKEVKLSEFLTSDKGREFIKESLNRDV